MMRLRAHGRYAEPVSSGRGLEFQRDQLELRTYTPVRGLGNERDVQVPPLLLRVENRKAEI
jgi:hypothetical protein